MTATVLSGRKETRLLLLFHTFDSCLLLSPHPHPYGMSAYSLAHIKSNAIVPQLRQGAMDAVYHPLMDLKSPFLHSLPFCGKRKGRGEKASNFGRQSLLCPTLLLLPVIALLLMGRRAVYYLEICFKKEIYLLSLCSAKME